MAFTDCWATFTGHPVISKWNLSTDAGPLLTEALRLLALAAWTGIGHEVRDRKSGTRGTRHPATAADPAAYVGTHNE
jgi:hypothetical protein